MALRKLAGQTLVYGMSTVLGRFLNWGLSFLFAHALGKVEMGVFTDLYAWVSYPLVLLTFGMETAFFRYASKTTPEAAYQNSFWTVATLGTSFSLLCLILLTPLARVLDYPGRETLILMLVGITLLDVLSAVPMARLRHLEQAKRFAGLNLLNILLNIVLGAVFVFGLQMGVMGVFLANLIASAVRFALALVGNLPRGFRLDRAVLPAMLTFGFVMMITQLSGQLNEMLDKNLLPDRWPDGKVWAGRPRTGLEMNGIYGLCYKLGMVIMLAANAYRYAAEPYFFKQSGNSNAPATMARVFHYFVMACMVVFVLVGSFAWEIASFDCFGLLPGPLMPRSFWVGLDVVPIVLLANVFLAAYLSLSIWYKLTEQLRYGLIFSFIGTAITVGLNWWLIPVYGYLASAWAHVACYSTMCVLSWWYGQRHYPVPYQMGRLGLYLLVCCAVVWINAELTDVWGTGLGSFAFKLAVAGAVIGGIVLLERNEPQQWKPLP